MEPDASGENGVQFEGEDEEEFSPISVDANKRIIRTSSADPEIESLYGKWKRGRLILQPDFQRHFVWDRPKASKLIESALMSVPLPIIYLAEEADGTESVIDGQQRLTSFFSFIDGKFPDGKPFNLNKLKVFAELNNKGYKDIDERLQDDIRYYQVRTITIRNDSDADLKFEIFERLNTGTLPLKEMELRNCVYRGKYMGLLKELAQERDFQSLLGLTKPDPRMKDVELVLRFATFYHATYLKYQEPIKRFMNHDMAKYQNISDEDANELRDAFRNALAIAKSLFGPAAFKRFTVGSEANPNGAWQSNQFNAALYDAIMGVFADKNKNQVYSCLDSLREGLIDLMTSNTEFVDAIVQATGDNARVKKRFDLARQRVEDILQNCKPQPRCFSNQLKQELYTSDPTCAICHQQIQTVDDAAVDHIQQYWRGGKTIPENARLAHRYCNNARSRND